MLEADFVSLSHFGTVSTEFLGEHVMPPGDGREDGLPVRQYRYVWRPPGAIRPRLPIGFFIEFDCFVGADGLRRFVPIGGYKLFIAKAFLAGWEILGLVQELDRERHYSYGAMRLLFNAVQKTQARLDRKFDSDGDLYIRRTGRENQAESTVFPEDVGMRPDGTGQKWSIEQLLKRGEESAREDGIKRPTKAQRIHYGLFEAARLNPLQVTKPREISSLVRAALFDLSSAETPKKEIKELVTERILIALNRHLEDDTDRFNAWFSGKHNNFLKMIADQPRQPGGKLAREKVRRVFLELGWEAHSYMANCMEAFILYFQRSLGEQLSPQERKLFEHAYRRRRYLGGLPLVLLLERKSFIKLAVLEIWSNPQNRESIAVLHRLLQYYSEMVANRRAADRRFKPKGRPVARSRKRPIFDSETSEADYEFVTEEQSDFSSIVEHIRGQRKLVARCKCGPLRAEKNATVDDQVKITCACECGSVDEQMTVTLREIENAGHAIGLYDGGSCD